MYILKNVYNLCSLLKKNPNPQTILSLTTLIKYGIYSLNKFNNYENALFFSKKRVDILTHFTAPNPLKIDFVHTICKVSRSMSIFVKTPSKVWRVRSFSADLSYQVFKVWKQQSEAKCGKFCLVVSTKLSPSSRW